jgi:alkylhydroperoxidase family enzyme
VEAIKRRSWRDATTLSPRHRALCEVAEKISGNPTRMTEKDWQPLRELGFDDEACLEVGHIVGIFNHLTRLADGFGLRLDAGTQQASRSGVALQRTASRAAS